MNYSYSEDYKEYINSLEWRRKSRTFRAWTKKCCLFPWKKATCSHHVHYGNLGNEWLIRDCVPLSNEAHLIVHKNKFWNIGETPDGKPIPSELRPWMSNYLRIMAVVLIFLNPILTTVEILGMIMKEFVSESSSNQLPPEPKPKPKPKLRKRL